MRIEVGRDEDEIGVVELMPDGQLRPVGYYPQAPAAERQRDILAGVAEMAAHQPDLARWLSAHAARHEHRTGLWFRAIDGQLPPHNPHAGWTYPEFGSPYRAPHA